MHLLSDAVSAQVANDSVAVLFGMHLNCMGEVAQSVSLPGHVCADPEAFFRNVHQLLRHGGSPADQHRKGAVRLPAIQNDATVDAQKLPLAELPSVCETMYHLIVH